jgi:murein DD-endopeptidase MepM/ murein hydrolase activator NlpD
MGRRYVYGRRKRSKAPLLMFLIMLVAAGAGFIYFSPKFERNPPSITLPDRVFWNKNSGQPIPVRLEDDSGLKSYQVILSDGEREVVVSSGTFTIARKEALISVDIPEHSSLDMKRDNWTMTVLVNDISMWNLLRGNSAKKSIEVTVDRQMPLVGIVANSPSIVRGGSALVIFQASDKNLKDVYVEAGGRRFEVLPYIKKGFYATLLAWPFRVDNFSAKVIAEDKAGNRRVVEVPFELIPKKYRVSWIGLSDRFLRGKIAEVASTDPEIPKNLDKLQRFRAVNEDMRKRNESLIHKYTSGVEPVDFGKWKLKAFYPLKRAKVVAFFGDERHYYYRDRKREVSSSWHLGYDLASTSHAPIYSSNPGKVVFADYNGIYGNMPIVDHGFGLYTLYGHCSSILVREGEKIEGGKIIAKTGKTGLALGDHLHFGILIQGVEVWPMDWMKQNWIKSHIDRVFSQARRVIGNR